MGWGTEGLKRQLAISLSLKHKSLCRQQRLSRFYRKFIFSALLHFQEDDRQSVEGQRLDQHQAENQGELDSGAGCWVAGQRLGGGCDGFALGQAADSGSDRHGESGGDGDPVGVAGGAALREGRQGEAQGGQGHEDTAELTHSVAPFIKLLPVGG